MFFQAQDKYTRVVTARTKCTSGRRCKELLGVLDADTFWQVHRSVIVRAGAIKRIERDAEGSCSSA